jgi:hypothetical protein
MPSILPPENALQIPLPHLSMSILPSTSTSKQSRTVPLLLIATTMLSAPASRTPKHTSNISHLTLLLWAKPSSSSFTKNSFSILMLRLNLAQITRALSSIWAIGWQEMRSCSSLGAIQGGRGLSMILLASRPMSSVVDCLVA